MTDDAEPRHPLLAAALDRSKPLAERRKAYEQWSDEHALHTHPHLGVRHSHAAGHLIHDHPKEIHP